MYSERYRYMQERSSFYLLQSGIEPQGNCACSPPTGSFGLEIISRIISLNLSYKTSNSTEQILVFIMSFWWKRANTNSNGGPISKIDQTHQYRMYNTPAPVDSILEAVFTVSPNRQYRGIVRPTTPATQDPLIKKLILSLLKLRWLQTKYPINR